MSFCGAQPGQLLEAFDKGYGGYSTVSFILFIYSYI